MGKKTIKNQILMKGCIQDSCMLLLLIFHTTFTLHKDFNISHVIFSVLCIS